MDSDTSHPLAKCKNYGVYYECVSTTLSWNIILGNGEGNFTWAFGAQSNMRHTFDAGSAGFVMRWYEQRRCINETEEGRERGNKDGPGSSVACFAVRQRDGEPTSAPIDNLYKLLRPEGALQLWAIPQLRQLLISCTLHTHTHTRVLDVSHSNMTASIWNIISSVKLCLSDAQKVFFPFASPLTRYMLCSRTFSAPFQTLYIDYLALVDPVDVKTFWIHLHGHRYSLCGVLDGDSGMKHGCWWIDATFDHLYSAYSL